MKNKRLQLTLDPDFIRDLKLYALLADLPVADLVVTVIKYAEETGFLSRHALIRVRQNMGDVQSELVQDWTKPGDPAEWEAMCREEELRNRELLSE